MLNMYFADFKQVGYFADFEEDSYWHKYVINYFADFEQNKKMLVVLLINTKMLSVIINSI